MNFDKAKQTAFLAEEAKEMLPDLADQAYEAIVQLKAETQMTPTVLLDRRDWIALECEGFAIMHAFGEGYKHGLRAPQEAWRDFVTNDGQDKTAKLIATVNNLVDEHIRQVTRLEELRGQLSRAVLDIKDALSAIRENDKEAANE